MPVRRDGSGELDIRSSDQDTHSSVPEDYLPPPIDDIVDATDSLNRLVGNFAAQKPVVDRALQTIPDALSALRDQRPQLSLH